MRVEWQTRRLTTRLGLDISGRNALGQKRLERRGGESQKLRKKTSAEHLPSRINRARHSSAGRAGMQLPGYQRASFTIADQVSPSLLQRR
jgi:hypothetical protein